MAEAVVGPDGLLRFGRQVLRASIGRAGITRHKREGDGATPAGRLALRQVMYRADRVPRPAARVPIAPIAPEDGWCDDPGHKDYNRPVRLPHEANCEALWRRDPLYDLVGVLGWNDSPVIRGAGSAIFLHVRAGDGGPTEGCLALDRADLETVLAAGVTEILVTC